MTTALSPFSERQLRDVFGRFPSSVVAVCALLDGRPDGMAVSTFVPVSLDPPLIAICVACSSQTWPRLLSSPRLGISLLSEGQAVAARRLAAKEGNRFEQLETRATESGAVFLLGASAWLETHVVSQAPAGDHCFAVLGIDSVDVDDGFEPLVFHRSTFRSMGSRPPGNGSPR